MCHLVCVSEVAMPQGSDLCFPQGNVLVEKKVLGFGEPRSNPIEMEVSENTPCSFSLILQGPAPWHKHHGIPCTHIVTVLRTDLPGVLTPQGPGTCVSLLLVFALIWYSRQPSVRGILISPPCSVWELRIREVQELAQSRTSHQGQLTSEPGSPTLALAGSLLPSPWVSVSAPTFQKPNSEAHCLHQAFPYASFLRASPALNFPCPPPSLPTLTSSCLHGDC